MSRSARLTSAEAARRLGVKPSTLYSYVSRGLIERDREGRRSTFSAQDVERLAQAASRRASGSGNAFDREMFETELTLIEDGGVRYRGLDVIELSRTRSFEDVAGWLWTGSWPPASGAGRNPGSAQHWPVPAQLTVLVTRLRDIVDDDVPPIDRLSVAVAAAATADSLRYDLRRGAVTLAAKGLIAFLVDVLPLVGEAAGQPDQGSIAERLWPRLTGMQPSPLRLDLLNAALVIMADHELAPSTLAARIAAMSRANPYAVVSTGLGPSSGLYHAAHATEVEVLLLDALHEDVERAMGRRLRGGVRIHGFGQELYPDGDPRGAELVRRLPDLGARPERVAVVERLLEIAAERDFPPPSAEFGLGALAFLAEMAPGSSQAIAILARVAGWVAHALEEYGNSTTFRARATYVGPR
jgi:citrate synthase